jgi:hypothetical protein
MEKIIENYIESIDRKYPQYSECTAYCAELYAELFVCDYNDFASESKSLRYVKSILNDLITYAYTNAGVKNYLKMIIGFFDLAEVRAFFSSAKIDTEELYSIIDCIESRIIYWQGYENSPPEKHLNHLLKPLINTKLK